MNGLSELNDYSNTGFEFTDDRPTTYSFYPDTPENQSVSSYENALFIAPAGTSITAIYNRTADLTFNVNVASLPGTTVVWNSLPAHLTQSNVGGVYTVSGIRSAADWEYLLEPIVDMAANPPTNWEFTSNIAYPGGDRSWSTAVTVTQLDQLTATSDYYYPEDVANLITGYPQVFALGLPASEPASYTCDLSSSDNSVFGNLAVSGGTFSSNVLSFSGNLSVMNTKLGNITYWPTDGIETEWLATYSLYNSSTGFTTLRNQTIKSQLATYLDAPEAFYYDRNILDQTVIGHPTIVDVVSNAATYTMEISSLSSGPFGNLTTTYGFGTSSFSANVLTITGNKATVNEHLNTLSYNPAVDWDENFVLRYKLTVSDGNVSIRLQDSLISANATIISNISVSRAYVSNTQDQIVFPTSVPQILEEIPAASYTFYISSTAGKFGHTAGGSGATASYSYTGTKAQINARLAILMFYPYKDITGNQTFTYEQYRNGVLQITQVVSYVGTARATPITGNGTTTYTSNTSFNLTYEQAHYLLANITITGGGGGGGGSAFKIYSTGYQVEAGGGGGGAGGTTSLTGNIIGGQAITIVVGQGGVGQPAEQNSGYVYASPGQAGTATTFTTPTYSIVCAGGEGGGHSECGTLSGNTRVISGNGGARGSPNVASGVAGKFTAYTPPGSGPSTASTREKGGDGAVRGAGTSRNGLGGAVSGEEGSGGTLTTPGSGGNGAYGSTGVYGGPYTLAPGNWGEDGVVIITFYED